MKKTLLISTSLIYLTISNSSFAAAASDEDISPQRQSAVQQISEEDVKQVIQDCKDLDLAVIRATRWLLCPNDNHPLKNLTGVYTVPNDSIIEVLRILKGTPSEELFLLLDQMAENSTNGVSKLVPTSDSVKQEI